ncbi:MAG TPA: nuclear transport factor 2 family protein [Candidatus Dormibacteraeota bacterium]|jgi:3-phenylpropionate/cinnamic acid dioxygenase small subunit|nr:nuclear transport factor 2 family protein [Candidatus Dormibacteraeota bacterium]
MSASTRDGVMETMSRYVRAVDDRDFPALDGIFAENVTYTMGAKAVHGREAAVAALRESLGGRPPMRHVVSSVSVTEQGADEATAISDWAMLALHDGAWMVGGIGRYHDRLRRQGDAWLFTERSIVMPGA